MWDKDKGLETEKQHQILALRAAMVNALCFMGNRTEVLMVPRRGRVLPEFSACLEILVRSDPSRTKLVLNNGAESLKLLDEGNAMIKKPWKAMCCPWIWGWARQ